jgi:hypothetical protein
MDYNLYYPDTETLFYISRPGQNFRDWKTALMAAGVTGADAHSLTIDPLLTNTSGFYARASDFTLQSISPAINKGDNTVWSGKLSVFDFTGSIAITNDLGLIIAPGGRVDIGAYGSSGTSLSPPSRTRIINQ